jgi:hypothetical protein
MPDNPSPRPVSETPSDDLLTDLEIFDINAAVGVAARFFGLQKGTMPVQGTSIEQGRECVRNAESALPKIRKTRDAALSSPPQGRGEVSEEVTDKQRLDAFINGLGVYLQMCGGQGTPAAWLELGQIVRKVLRKDMGDMDWRKLAFAQHSHGADGACLYGDDGELSCASCGADFKRMTSAELSECFVRYNLKHHGEEAAHVLAALRPAPSSPETPQ